MPPTSIAPTTAATVPTPPIPIPAFIPSAAFPLDCGTITVCTSTTVLLPLALSVLRLIGVSDGTAGAGTVAAGAFVVGEATRGGAGLDGLALGVPAVEVGETWFVFVFAGGALDGLALPLAVTVTVLFVVLGNADEPDPPPGFEGVEPGQTLLRAPLSEPRSPVVQLLLLLAQEKDEEKKPGRWLHRQAVSDLHADKITGYVSADDLGG